MGSETGAKWFVAILLYFAIMIFTVALIEDTSGSTISTLEDTSGTYCGYPRDIYQVINEEAFSTDTDGDVNDKMRGHLECEYSIGVLSETLCEEIEGCSWEASSFWFWETAYDTCKGTITYSQFDEEDIKSWWGFGDYIEYEDDDGDETIDLCLYPEVINNETLCNRLGCNWGYKTSTEEALDIEIEISIVPYNMLTSIWGVTKDMLTFNFDLGFDDTSLNFIIYFIIFWLPLIGMALAIYVMVRS